MKVAALFNELCEFGMALGMKDLNQLPGCWEQQVDEHWWIACNAHRERVKCSTGESVPPFCFYIVFNGWPAGIVNAGGGTMCAGAIANESALIAAVQQAKRAVA